MLRRIKRLWKLFQEGINQAPKKSRREAILNLEWLEDRSLPSANFSGTIGGVVYASAGNSQFSSSDSLLPGVQVTLTGTVSFGGTAVNQSTTTSGDGSYNFANVLPGSYRVSTGTVSGFLGGGAVQSGTMAVGDGQQVTNDLGIAGGLAPQYISMLDFLTTTTASALPFAPAGSGQALANYQPDSFPIVTSQIPTQDVDTSANPTQIDLAGYFTSPGMTDSEVTMNITNGGVPETLNVTLFDPIAPDAVDNFFDYINAGDYNNALFTRLVDSPTPFVLQGGGLQLSASGTNVTATPVLPAIPNQYSKPNSADTLAMAMTGSNINSATNQFFFNLDDNSSTLDPQDFVVFGQLADATSDANLDTLAQTTVSNESTTSVATANPSVDLSDLPLTNYDGTDFPSDAGSSNYMVINSVTIDKRDQWLNFSATSSNPGLVSASVNDEWLTLDYVTGKTGMADITVTATDRYGASVNQTFEVDVSPTAPTIQSVAIAPNNPADVTTLTATPTSTDAQGLPVSYKYQWLQNGTAISGATSATLTLPSDTALNDKFTVEVTPSDSELTGSTFTSPAATIASLNPTTIDLPSVQTATITPNSDDNVTSLTVAATGDDPNDAALEFNYQWLQNGDAISGATGATLTLPADTAVGDQFSVQITPGDGTLTGPMFTSQAVTVATINPVTLDLPTVQSVSIAPDDPTDTTTLTATPVGTDPLGQTLTYAYQWYQSGTAISGATNAVLTIPTSATAGTEFTVQVTPSDSTLTGQAFTSNAVTLATVSPFTLQAPTIQSVTIAPDNYSNATQLTATVDSASPALFTYQWLQNGQAISGATEATLSLSSITVNPNDQFSVNVTPAEGTLTGSAVSSNVVSIVSTGPIVTTGTQAPSVTSVAVTPNSTTNVTSLTAAPNGSDPLGLGITYTYQWLENGSPISGATSATLTLPNGVNIGAQFTVQVIPTDADGTVGTAFTSGAATIGTVSPTTILLPAVASVAVAPNSTSDATTLTATPAGSDPNNATLTYTYVWLDNGTAVSGGTTATLTLPSTTAVGDQFTVQVTPSDGTLTGPTYTSSASTVATISPITFT